MTFLPLVCVHGYGVRGFFWDGFRKEAEAMGLVVYCPDLKLDTAESGVEELRDYVNVISSKHNSPVALMGHSLGGVLSALASKQLAPSILGALILVSSPFGERRQKLSPFVRFLLFRGWLPGWIVRPAFFGPDVPVRTQQALFSKAVKESQALQAMSASSRWFHSEAFPKSIPTKSMVIATELDRVVPYQESLAFAAAIGATYVVFPATERIGHDDVGVDPRVAQLVLKAIKELLRA